jgi:hypothetical protein
VDLSGLIILSYLAIGALSGFAAFLFVGRRSLELADQPIDQVWGLVALQRQLELGPLARIRWILRRALPLPANIISWPAFAILHYRGAKTKGYRGRSRSIALMPLNLMVALASCAFALLLGLLRLLDGPSWAIDTGCIFLLVGLLSSLICDTISTTDLPGMMRRNLMPPYLQFVLVAVLNYLSLFIGALLWKQLRTEQHLSFDVLKAQVRSLNDFANIFAAVTRVPDSAGEALLTLCGIAYFAMIGKLLFQYRQFIRQPADYALIISNLGVQGKFAMARRWLNGINAQTRNDSAMIAPRLLVLIGENENDKAYRLAEAMYSLRSEEGVSIYRTRGVDDILTSLISTSKLIDLDPTQYRQLLRFAVNRGISDACLSIHISPLLGPAEINHPDGLTELAISFERFPVTHCLVQWLLTDDRLVETEARRQLASIQPDSDVGVIAQLIADIRMRMYQYEDVTAPLEEVFRLISEADSLPGWSRMEFALWINEIVDRSIISPDLQLQAQQCERALLVDASEDELELYKSLRNVARMLTS